MIWQADDFQIATERKIIFRTHVKEKFSIDDEKHLENAEETYPQQCWLTCL